MPSWGANAAGWIAVIACVIAVVALALAVGAWSRGARVGRRPPRSLVRRRPGRGNSDEQALTPGDVAAELETLRADAYTALRHVAVVRYDAFGDMGGHLSWSLALLDDRGDGLVLTSIHGRSDSRTYAKNVSGWSSSQQLSPEEQQAIGFARSAD